ncbi:ribosome maturation factor RimM [Amphiplicatus metriothermophilus]|uniref:Ribosome maturation factor RimM n=1 Tax=Amphiplicatus metriothermophilus TaxID=1519374 RepID=A0A239PJA6_9PROT|nr:ribosome maturation factor RimM [Amphiplicatus metriothermophilus]MBB5517962.1 16S rRNA processing protein RimM [Amphiplicatus metriothermophilus]SNT67705.1 16S rRNA processing protein RimM [Amphiplicatus metriothermophilus]
MNAPDKRRVCLGAIAGAHGVKGEMKIRTFTEREADVTAYGPTESEDGARRFTLEVVRVLKPGLILARAPEIQSREDAAALAGTRLYVPRTALPALEDEDEFYVEDLVGLQAVDESGARLGRVVAVHNFGAGDILELGERDGGARAVMIPFLKTAVPAIDLEAGRLTVAREALGAAESNKRAPTLRDDAGVIASDDLGVDLDAMRQEDA